MPRPLKPAALRQRTNRHTTAATLPTEQSMASAEIPQLPGHVGNWHPETLGWWGDVWRSPMASQYLQVDIRGLHRLAMLHNDFWNAESPSLRASIDEKLRLNETRFGLSNLDRARLQWEIDKGDEAEERVTRRKQSRQPKPGQDPRELMKVVGA